jgi:adenylate cyclase
MKFELYQRVRRQLTIGIGAANVVGALLVLVFLGYVVPTPAVHDSNAVLRLNLLVFAGFMPVAIVVGHIWSLRVTAPVRAWLVAARAPDEHELEATLREPLLLAGASAGVWVLAALIFGVINVTQSGLLGLQVAATVLLGGLATCALIYLVSERLLRSTVALALVTGVPEQPALPGVATRIVLAWVFGTGLALLGTGLVAGVFLLGGPGSPDRLAATVLFLTAFAFMAGLATVVVAAQSVADPLGSVRRALGDVEGGDLEADVPVNDSSELGLLQAGLTTWWPA